MGPLGSALVAVVTPANRQPPFTVELTTRHDPEYASDLLGGMATPLGRRAARSGFWPRKRSGMAGPASPARHPSFFGARLQVQRDDQWRYEEIDESGDTVFSLGLDGSQGWSRTAHGSRNEWTPTVCDDPRQLSDSTWQFHASLSVREVVEPVLMLPALAIHNATSHPSRHGAVVRLYGSPQLTDRIESALVSVSAATCVVDLHQQTGTVIRATNLDPTGHILVEHTVTAFVYGSQAAVEQR